MIVQSLVGTSARTSTEAMPCKLMHKVQVVTLHIRMGQSVSMGEYI